MSAIRLPELVFPDSDGKPMSENTRQYEAIVTLKGNIEAFAPTTAFVAGDHMIYADPNNPAVCQAPDVYVAFGRPRGHRGSYKVWEEDGVFPQVVFEVLGPSNTPREMHLKRRFYFGHGAEEYYEFDPEAGTWFGFIHSPDTGLAVEVPSMDDHVSPRLGMRFGFRPMELVVHRPDGSEFLSFQEHVDRGDEQARRADDAERRAAAEREWAVAERQRADAAERQVAAERANSERLLALLKKAGLDPDAPPPVAPMTDEDAFLKSICDAPDDDTPRLVFADFLQERGNPFDTAWASLIRTQVGAATAPPGEGRDALLTRSGMIATPFFRDKWLKRLAAPTTYSMRWGAAWVRGFLGELGGPFADILAARRSFVDRVPYRSLDIGVRTLTEFRRMLAWREVRRITSLTAYSNQWVGDFGDAHAVELANCAALVGLVALHLRYVRITDRGATDLLDSIPLRGLRELTLSWTDQPGGVLSRTVRKRLTDRFGPHCLR